MHWAIFNYLEFQLPDDCISDLSGSGDCTASCEYWQSELKLNLNRDAMISELKEYGAWSEQELNDLPNSELEMKCIWIAAGNIADDLASDD